jgi:hypothetical protein
MICKLCGKDKELRKSHIIPEFFFKRYTPKDGTFLQAISPKLHHTPTCRRGYYEKLLCADCEALTAKWDNAGINFVQTSEAWERKQYRDRFFFEINDFDFPNLKLFFMSILWRASVSTLPFFSIVNLGALEERLLCMLKRADPGSIDDFGVMLFKYTAFDDGLEKIISSPVRFKPERINHYRFRLNEFAFIIKADQRPLRESQKFFCLKPKQPLKVFEAEFSSSKELSTLIKVIELQNQFTASYHKNRAR